jgi:glutathione S-transferase
MADLTLIGYRYSVYTRVAKMVLAEKGLSYSYTEADPFRDPPEAHLQAANPFLRVPVLQHGDFTLYETTAISHYIDGLRPAPALVPDSPPAAARMRQIIGIVDSDAYRVLVRQVYSHAVFRPAFGVSFDAAIIEAGRAAAPRILAALEGIAAEGLQLGAGPVSLADLHLAPMIAAFVAAPRGRDMLDAHSALAAWFARIQTLPAFAETSVALPRG